MNEEIKKRFLSTSRLSGYHSFKEYELNLKYSKKFYILLALLEVSLRNSINNTFQEKYSFWFRKEILHEDSLHRVHEVKMRLLNRKESISDERILAELSFGFWTALFRKSYSHTMRYGTLKQIFPNLPKKENKIINREFLNKKLNHIRKFRNRIFHYEKVVNKKEYEKIEEEIFEILFYFDEELCKFAKRINA